MKPVYRTLVSWERGPTTETRTWGPLALLCKYVCSSNHLSVGDKRMTCDLFILTLSETGNVMQVPGLKAWSERQKGLKDKSRFERKKGNRRRR